MADGADPVEADARVMADHLTTVQEIYAAFGRGDLDAILDRIADEPDWCWALPDDVPGATAVPFLRHVTTKADVADVYFGNVAKTLEFHAFTPRRLFADGDDVVALIDLDLTVVPTGRRLQLSEVHHFSFDADGRIERYRNYLDTATLVDAFVG
jgi:uncharacterized protein